MNWRDVIESIHKFKFENHITNNLRSFRQLYQAHLSSIESFGGLISYSEFVAIYQNGLIKRGQKWKVVPTHFWLISQFHLWYIKSWGFNCTLRQYVKFWVLSSCFCICPQRFTSGSLYTSYETTHTYHAQLIIVQLVIPTIAKHTKNTLRLHHVDFEN